MPRIRNHLKMRLTREKLIRKFSISQKTRIPISMMTQRPRRRRKPSQKKKP